MNSYSYYLKWHLFHYPTRTVQSPLPLNTHWLKYSPSVTRAFDGFIDPKALQYCLVQNGI